MKHESRLQKVAEKDVELERIEVISGTMETRTGVGIEAEAGIETQSFTPNFKENFSLYFEDGAPILGCVI